MLPALHLRPGAAEPVDDEAEPTNGIFSKSKTPEQLLEAAAKKYVALERRQRGSSDFGNIEVDGLRAARAIVMRNKGYTDESQMSALDDAEERRLWDQALTNARAKQ